MCGLRFGALRAALLLHVSTAGRFLTTGVGRFVLDLRLGKGAVSSLLNWRQRGEELPSSSGISESTESSHYASVSGETGLFAGSRGWGGPGTIVESGCGSSSISTAPVRSTSTGAVTSAIGATASGPGHLRSGATRFDCSSADARRRCRRCPGWSSAWACPRRPGSLQGLP